MRDLQLRWKVAQLGLRLGHDRPWSVAEGPARGLRIRADRASGDYVSGRNERPVQEAVASILRPGATFVDIGANIGFFSLLAARLIGPQGRVFAFEPVPENAALIRANAEANQISTITVFELAVSRSSGPAILALDDHPGGAFLVSDPVAERQTLQVDKVSLDELVADGRVGPPDLVKIDTEGGELDVLAGMAETLAAHRPTLVIEIDAPTAGELASKLGPMEAELARLRYRVDHLPAAYSETVWHVAHLVARP